MGVNRCRGLGATASASVCGCEWVVWCGWVGGEVVLWVAVVKLCVCVLIQTCCFDNSHYQISIQYMYGYIYIPIGIYIYMYLFIFRRGSRRCIRRGCFSTDCIGHLGCLSYDRCRQQDAEYDTIQFNIAHNLCP